jgi:hypothetical protein
MTLPGKLRETALEIAKRTDDDLDDDEYDLIALEQHWLIGLSKELGITLYHMLEQMTSRELTEYRAASIVDAAQQQILDAQIKRKQAMRERRFGRRR